MRFRITIPVVDPDSGAARAHPLPWSDVGAAVAGLGILVFAVLVLWAVWSWTPFNLRASIGELETRMERLERIHELNHELEELRDEVRRQQALEATPEREVPL